MFNPIISPLPGKRLKVAGKLKAVKELPAHSDDEIVMCPACRGSGLSGSQKVDRHGDVWDDVCAECLGDCELTLEEATFILSRNPEIAFRNSCIDVMVERIKS